MTGSSEHTTNHVRLQATTADEVLRLLQTVPASRSALQRAIAQDPVFSKLVCGLSRQRRLDQALQTITPEKLETIASNPAGFESWGQWYLYLLNHDVD